MPFFGKVNLLPAAEDLMNRGFKVALARTDAAA